MQSSNRQQEDDCRKTTHSFARVYIKNQLHKHVCPCFVGSIASVRPQLFRRSTSAVIVVVSVWLSKRSHGSAFAATKITHTHTHTNSKKPTYLLEYYHMSNSDRVHMVHRISSVNDEVKPRTRASNTCGHHTLRSKAHTSCRVVCVCVCRKTTK